MQLEQKTIFLKTEAEFFASEEHRLGKQFIRQFYQNLCLAGKHEYENLELQSSPPAFSTMRITDDGKTVSRCEIKPHAIGLCEDGHGAHIEDFSDTVKTVFGTMIETCHSLKKDTPLFIMQRSQIRILAKPSSGISPLELLAGNASQVFGAVKIFQRPPAYFGMRFRFLPNDAEEVNNIEGVEEDWAISNDDHMTLRFETYSENLDYIWIECSSMTPLFPHYDPDAPETETIERLENNVKKLSDFAHKNAVDFLNQFDQANEDDSDEEQGHE